MTKTILITGAASGIGKATAARLAGSGARVITADLQNADIEADLGSADGRAELVAKAFELAPGGLDGVIAAAGIGDPQRIREVVAVNYFGAIATLEGLRPLLARSAQPRAVAVTSTAGFLPVDEELLSHLVAGHEAAAVQRATEHPSHVYAASKRALSLWVRRMAVSPDWVGAGIFLNAVGPGLIDTPMSNGMLRDPKWLEIIKRSNPVALDTVGQSDEVAELLDFMVRFRGNWMLGQIVYIDGGTDALMRPVAV